MTIARFDDARSLTERAGSRLQELREHHEQSLVAGEASIELRADIMEVVGYLCSALEYCGGEIYERHGAPPRRGKRPGQVGFPVLVPRAGSTVTWPQLLDRKLPGVAKSRPDLAKLLEGYQVTTDLGNQWLVDLHCIWTEGKHDHLGDQAVGVSRKLVIGRFLRIAEGANVTLEGVVFDGHVVKGRQRVGVDNPPEDFSGPVEQTSSPAFVWELGGRKVAVLPLLTKSVSRVERIVREVTAAV